MQIILPFARILTIISFRKHFFLRLRKKKVLFNFGVGMLGDDGSWTMDGRWMMDGGRWTIAGWWMMDDARWMMDDDDGAG